MIRRTCLFFYNIVPDDGLGTEVARASTTTRLNNQHLDNLVAWWVTWRMCPSSDWSCPGPVFCLFLGVSSDYAQPITGQVTEVTCLVNGKAQPKLTSTKRQKTGPWDRLSKTELKIITKVHHSHIAPQATWGWKAFCPSSPTPRHFLIAHNRKHQQQQ